MVSHNSKRVGPVKLHLRTVTVTRALFHLADTLHTFSEHHRALNIYQQILDISQSATGGQSHQKHPVDTADIFAKMAGVHTSLMRLPQAISRYEKALVLRENTIPKNTTPRWRRSMTGSLWSISSKGGFWRGGGNLQQSVENQFRLPRTEPSELCCHLQQHSQSVL